MIQTFLKGKGEALKNGGTSVIILYKGCPYKRPLQMESLQRALTDLIW